MKIKILDVLFVIFFLFLIIILSYRLYIKPSGIVQVIIQGQNDEWIFSIDAEETIMVKGPIGDTVVRIGGGSAWVESSPCNNQNCVVTGFVKRQGQWAACLPNQVLVMLQGSNIDNEEVDAVTR